MLKTVHIIGAIALSALLTNTASAVIVVAMFNEDP